MLTWEAATRRLINACMIHRNLEAHTNVDRALVNAHNWVGSRRRDLGIIILSATTAT